MAHLMCYGKQAGRCKHNNKERSDAITCKCYDCDKLGRLACKCKLRQKESRMRLSTNNIKQVIVLWYPKRHIKYCYSCLLFTKQNSMANRLNRMVAEKTTAMLIKSKLLKNISFNTALIAILVIICLVLNI